MIPTIGRIVLYCLRDSDAGAINRRRQNARTHVNELRGNSTGVMVHASIRDRLDSLSNFDDSE